MQSQHPCRICKGNNVWKYTGALRQEEYCRDCEYLCDCGKTYSRKLNACPDCKRKKSTATDAERVAKWIEIVKEEGECNQTLENLGLIGPAAEPALYLVCNIYLKHRKSSSMGAAAYDALRDHDAVKLCELGLLREQASPAPTPPPAADKIRFACTQCGHGVSVAAAHAGKRGKCPGCGATMTIPAAPAPAAVEAPKPLLELVPKALALKLMVCPVDRTGGVVSLLATSDEAGATEKMELIFNCPILLLVTTKEDVLAAIKKHYP